VTARIVRGVGIRRYGETVDAPTTASNTAYLGMSTPMDIGAAYV
jgi:hypothetical protein